MINGQSSSIRVDFHAYPKPTMGHWKIGDCIVPDKRVQDSFFMLLKQGIEAKKLSEDQRKTCFDTDFNSSQIMAGAFADEYFLDLNFTMSTLRFIYLFLYASFQTFLSLHSR